jgi:hypothetical protein
MPGLGCCLPSLDRRQDAVSALRRVVDADQVLIHIVREQPARRHVLAAQDDDAPFLRAVPAVKYRARMLVLSALIGT